MPVGFGRVGLTPESRHRQSEQRPLRTRARPPILSALSQKPDVGRRKRQVRSGNSKPIHLAGRKNRYCCIDLHLYKILHSTVRV